MAPAYLLEAAAGAVVVTVIGGIRYIRSRANLVLWVRQYEFEVPATAQQALAKLADVISPWSDEPLGEIEGDVAASVEAMLKVFGTRLGPRITTFWRLDLTNRGRDRAAGIELYVPEAVQIEVIEPNRVVAGDRVVIGELEPGQSVKVVAWGSEARGDPSVTQSKGRVVLRRG